MTENKSDMKNAAVIALAFMLTGCTVAGTPVAEPQKLHCDMIFPGGPSAR